MAGELVDLPGGWPEPFRTKVLAGRDVKIGVTPLTDEDALELAGTSEQRRDRLNRLLFPAPTRAYAEVRETYGDLSVLDTADYLDRQSDVEGKSGSGRVDHGGRRNMKK